MLELIELLSEEKVYDLIKVELRHAKSNNFGRTLFIQILKYCKFFDDLRITSSGIRTKLGIPICYVAQISLARNLYSELRRSGFDADRL